MPFVCLPTPPNAHVVPVKVDDSTLDDAGVTQGVHCGMRHHGWSKFATRIAIPRDLELPVREG